MCEKQLRRGRGAQGQSIARGMRVNAGPLCSSSLHTALRVGGQRQLRTSGLGFFEAKQRLGRNVGRRTVNSWRSIIINFRLLWQRLDSGGVLIQRERRGARGTVDAGLTSGISKMSGYQTHGFARLW